MRTRLFQWMLAATLVCSMNIFTACNVDDNPAKPTPGVDSKIVGNWYSDVSGKTYAKWNYGKTWQNTEFKADGTGSTRIYYTLEGNSIGIEKIDFTYTASADGVLTMTPNDREVMAAKWQLMGDGGLVIGDGENLSLSFKKTTSDMAAKFDTWSISQDVTEVPQPAKHTVFVYGTAGGAHDYVIEEGFWEKARTFLTDHDKVRVICFYKYGKDKPALGSFSGKYAEPGDIVWFELTNQTDLNKIKEEGFQAHGMGDLAKILKICNPNTMRLFLECSSLQCPAEKYSLAIWGHGSGFEVMNDVPGKYDVVQVARRGMMADEWYDGEFMDMYEMCDAFKAAGIDRLNTLFLHNCYMGNIESLTQARGLADYIVASAHVLYSGGEPLTEFVRGLMDKGNAEDAMGQMFERIEPSWSAGYSEDGGINNGDYKMLRMDKFDVIIDACKRLCDRVIALYPTQREAIDRATRQVYRYQKYIVFEYVYPFFDISNYAQLLAKETGDAELTAIAAAMDQAFKETIVHYRDINNSVQHLDHYTLSVCLMCHNSYVEDYKNNYPDIEILSNFNESYELCDFHKLTGWGNWLNMNQQSLDSNPQYGGGGKLE